MQAAMTTGMTSSARIASRLVPRTLFFAALYAVTIALARPFELPGGASPWYPAAGVLLAWLTVDGWRIAPVAFAIRLGMSFGVHDHSSAPDAWAEIALAAAVVVIHLLAAIVVRRSRAELGVRRLVLFTSCAVLPAALAAAFADTVVTQLATETWGTTTRTFFIGDAIGMMALTPVLLAWTGTWRPGRGSNLSGRDSIEAALQIVALVAVPTLAAAADVDGLFLVVLVIGLGPLMWSAMRREPRHLALAVLVSTTVTAYATRVAIARGPFVEADLLVVQSLMLTAAIVAYFVSAIRFDDIRRERLLTDAQRKLAWTATHDPATGALNRQGFVSAAASQPGEARLVVIDLGIPADTLHVLGTQFADTFAATAVEQLRSIVGEAPVARLDTAVLATVARGAADRVEIDASRLIAGMSTPLVVDGVEMHPNPHLGMAAQDAPADAAVEQAAFAAHLARQRGVASLSFDAGIAAIAGAERSRLAELQGALRNGEIVAWFQPIVRTTDRQIVGAEALARWIHPQLGVVTAADFIPTAESSGLVGAIGRIVRTSTLECASRLTSVLDGRDFRFSINVSAIEFQDSLVDDLVADLAVHAIDPRRVVVEVTETTAMRDMTVASHVLSRLRDIGMSVAIDDFGTGQSSMAHLQVLPADELKIDARFVRGLPAVRDLAIVRSIQSLADEFHLGVVAEGVETEEQMEALSECQVRHVQGYLTGRAMSSADLEATLTDSAAR
jgi:EAL domain-containing protein (putative c-di-GMP-specific phosphodiesterase class I)/integral membrane sensor domain MASE1/GGDEF domain-containing protein